MDEPEEMEGLDPSDEIVDKQLSRLQSNFEGKQALYVEQGALLVRVSNIRTSALRRTVAAQVDEIPVAGLRVGRFGDLLNNTAPLHWTIRAGYLTEFSDHSWAMGYGGWSLHFDPRLIEAVLELVSAFSSHLDPFDRYSRITVLLNQHQSPTPLKQERVFRNH